MPCTIARRSSSPAAASPGSRRCWRCAPSSAGPSRSSCWRPTPSSTTGRSPSPSRSDSARCAGSSWRRIAADHEAHLRAAALRGVDACAGVALTDRGERLDYDFLVVAVGARQRPAIDGALTFGGSGDRDALEGVIGDDPRRRRAAARVRRADATSRGCSRCTSWLCSPPRGLARTRSADLEITLVITLRGSSARGVRRGRQRRGRGAARRRIGQADQRSRGTRVRRAATADGVGPGRPRRRGDLAAGPRGHRGWTGCRTTSTASSRSIGTAPCVASRRVYAAGDGDRVSDQTGWHRLAAGRRSRRGDRR